MIGRVIKKILRCKFESLIDSISDDFDYQFVTNQSCFDGCSDTYHTKPSTPFEIECALSKFLKGCSISDKITINA